MAFSDLQNQLRQAREEKTRAEHRLFVVREKLGKNSRDKDQLSRFAGGDNDPASNRLRELEQREQELLADIQRLEGRLFGAAQVEHDRLLEILPFTDPREHIGNLDDNRPILLLPLRIETRFKQLAAGTAVPRRQLWVRVFPDEISVDTFEPIPSENEIRNARSYWTAVWKAGGVEGGLRGAWRSLVSAHGSGRAFWLTRNYRPLNEAEIPVKAAAEAIVLVISTESPPAGGEVEAIRSFWKDTWVAADNLGQSEAAWNDLLAALGQTRAQEILLNPPANLAERPKPPLSRQDTDLTVAFVVFPTQEETESKLQSWTQAPRVNTLPERLVLLGYDANQTEPVLSVLGAPIPSPLITGPNPLAGEDDQLKGENGEITVSEDMKWMVDFEAAIAKGMGFKLDLDPIRFRTGFDRLFVLGVRLGADKDEGKLALETLFEHHAQSRKGLSILNQGTPTNNTEKEGAGYSWRRNADESFDTYFAGEAKEDPSNWARKRDGRWLAETLGIDPQKLTNLANYYATDQLEAKAMNLALWPATLGYFMETLMKPVFADNIIARTKSFFTRYVSGRGMIPAICVGNQPYGILPATRFTRMDWLNPRVGASAASATPAQDPEKAFLHKLYKVLAIFHTDWAGMQAQVAHVGKRGDPHQILLDVLGLHPASVEWHSRVAQSTEQIYNTLGLKGLAGRFLAMLIAASYVQSGKNLLQKMGHDFAEDETIPEILKKFFFSRNDRLKGPLIDDVPLSEIEAVRSYTEDGRNYIQWLIDAARTSHDALRKQRGFSDDQPPSAILYLMLQHALDLSFIESSLLLHANAGILSPAQVIQAKIEPKFLHIKDTPEVESNWKYLYQAEAKITNQADLLVGEYIAQNMDELDEAFVPRRQLQALARLKDAPTARLERAFVEHLDTCSYRLDSWLMGLVHYQLNGMRELDSADGTRQGIYLGAYGWLENVRPEHKQLTPAQLDEEQAEIFQDPDNPLVTDNTNAGYIHAPSLNHAVTAAVLRNGYLSNATPANPGSLAVNLSSERVRLALSIIEGMRGGQSLAALLGYRLERCLHDRHDVEVDELIFDLRKAFPLRANRFKRTRVANVKSISRVEARNVVNGLAIIEKIRDSGQETYPFGAELPEDVSLAQKNAVNQEVKRIIDINDAVADLAMAESIHQVVQGNYDRAAATLETYSKGNFPPTPDVVRTPRSGVTLTHRIGLHLNSGADPLDPANTTPRSRAEPAVNQWLRQILPAPDAVACAAAYFDHDAGAFEEKILSQTDLGLLAIDLLYMVDLGREQAMAALDDAICLHLIDNFTFRADAEIRIDYTKKIENKITFFELAPLLASLRALLLRSRPLKASDVRLSLEAGKLGDEDIFLNKNRIAPLVGELETLLANQVNGFIANLAPLVDGEDLTAIEAGIDGFIDDLAAALAPAGRFGLPQTGIGDHYQRKRQIFARLMTKLSELITRWQEKLSVFDAQIAAYDALPVTAVESEKFDLLGGAEREIATANTVPLPGDPDDYRDDLTALRRVAFANKLEDFKLLAGVKSLAQLLQGITNQQSGYAAFDTVPLDISDQERALLLFATDLKLAAENLKSDLEKRIAGAIDQLQIHDDSGDPGKKTAALLEAGKLLFGEDFRIVPQFTTAEAHGDEWQNALADSDQLTRYLTGDLEVAFPLDDWLYGMARVREKMAQLEKATLLAETLSGGTLDLVPCQFPHREKDYWLAMEYPQKKDGGEEPLVIDEDKLLYTAIYGTAFTKAGRQCGLLLDEWTEVIPSEEETTALTFHYDRPNSEPPQTLLLVTPSNFRGSWQWRDLVGALHETLDLAKIRAVEPTQVDHTDYARFLPALVSSMTVHPIMASLNLALNNKFFTLRTQDDE